MKDVEWIEDLFKEEFEPGLDLNNDRVAAVQHSTRFLLALSEALAQESVKPGQGLANFQTPESDKRFSPGVPDVFDVFVTEVAHLGPLDDAVMADTPLTQQKRPLLVIIIMI